MAAAENNPEEIFCEALEIQDPVQRAAYLDGACRGDVELRARVEALLKAHERAGNFLQVPAGATLDSSPRIDGPGTVIGRYELLELIGEGGMGLVYLAEQKEPVRRKVALKIIKPGMDSRQVIARFEAERQALAVLDHPNVAHVFDAGCTETGRPYFVMEYVKGLSITRYCDQNRLNIEHRLRLFRQVCEGVHHAHQKGIIHRDLKPSNILISVHGDRVLPKIIDFGIAKATTQPLTDKTVFTCQGQLLGTPEYMSPEQVDLAVQDIDTRSDIYSLGVVLYELLAGVLPFEGESLARLGFVEVQRTIQEKEPAAPSRRLSGLGEQAKAIAESRRTQVVPLARCLHRELEWIPLKAMRKDRCRRYRSAAEFADDVQNYLDGNPLIAGPETAVYRVKKFVRRHAGSVATVSLIAVAIVLGLVISTAMYWKSERALQREAAARAEAEQARGDAEDARVNETVARTRAEQAEKATREKAEQLRRNLYTSSIQLADAKHREGNASQVRSILDSCPEDLRGWEWYRLNYIRDESLTTLHTHHNALTRAVLSNNGKRIFTSGEDTTIRVWDLATGEMLRTFQGQNSPVCAMAVSPDGKYIAYGGDEGTVKLWNAETGAEVVTLRGHPSPVMSLAFGPTGKRLAAGSYSSDGAIIVWDVPTGAPIATSGGQTEVRTLAFSPDGKHIASGSGDWTIKLWDAQTGTEVTTLRGHKGWVLAVGFNPDGTRIISGSRDKTIRVWDAESGDMLTMIAGHEGAVIGVAFNPHDELIVSGSDDNTVRVWDAQTGKEMKRFHGHEAAVGWVAFSPDGTHIVSGSRDDTVKTWDAVIDRESTIVHAHGSLQVAFSPDGRQIISSAWHSATKWWDAQTGEPIRTDQARVYGPRPLAVGPDGRQIVSGTEDSGVAHVWNALTGAQLLALRGHQGTVRCAAFSPDGKHIISGSDDKTVRLWDATSGDELTAFHGHECAVRSVAFGSDGKQVASGDEDGTVKIWDVATGFLRTTLQGHKDWVLAVGFSPDGTRIVSGSEDHKAKVWDVTTGTELLTLDGHRDFVFSVAFSPDAKRIVTGGRDETVRLWDSATGAELLALRANARVCDLAFSPDGTIIAAGAGRPPSDMGSVVMWESTAPAGGYESRRSVEIAKRIVERLHTKCGFYQDVTSGLQNDATLAPAVRRIALNIAHSCMWEDAHHLTSEAWSTVRVPGKDVTAYQSALDNASRAHECMPNDPGILDTLGATQYRTGSYEDALKSLVRSARVLRSPGEEPDPGNVAFTAMALYRIGRSEDAKVALAQLRELCKQEQLVLDLDIQGLLAEAEGLIEGKKP
jgi:WD40 repeat protein/serine/threonine protein kinase